MTSIDLVPVAAESDPGNGDIGSSDSAVTDDNAVQQPTGVETPGSGDSSAIQTQGQLFAIDKQILQYGDAGILQDFTLSAIDSATFSYQISSDSDWVQVLPASGTVPGGVVSIEVHIDRAQLAAGTHLALLSISANAAADVQPVYVVAHQPETPTVMSEEELVAALRELPPLQKVHYNWPLPGYLSHPEVRPLLEEYVRITHAICVPHHAHPVQYRRLFEMAARIDAENPDQPAVRLGVKYSPWHEVFPADAPPTDFGPDHDAEVDLFRERMVYIRDSVAQANLEAGTNVEVAVVYLACERFYVRDPAEPNAATWNAAIDAKYNAIFDIARLYFPEAAIDWHGRGGVHRCASGDGWCPFAHFTGNEPGDEYSVALYSLPEIGGMRETFSRTVAAAQADGMPRVMPVIALAAGYQRSATQGFEFTFDWDYDKWYSWQLGTEVNIAWYGDRPDRFAPWHWAEYAYFYPEPFGRSPHWGEHFVAYVRGAAGMSLPE